MSQPYTKKDLECGERIVRELHGLKGYDAWSERIAKAIAAERESCAACIEAHADLGTNSLHCGDNAMTIHEAHRESAALKRAAAWLRRT